MRASNATLMVPPEAIPVIEGFAESIVTPAVIFLMIGTIFPTLLLVMLGALFYFSTKTTRTRPIFLLNVLDLLLGIATGIWNGYIEINTLVHPFSFFSQSLYLAFGVVLSFVSWISELVLLLRLVAVFPIQLTGRKTLMAILAFPIFVKIVRLACMVCYYVQFSEVAPPYGNNILTIELGPTHSPYIKVEWTLEIFDNGYVSTLFLWRLYTTYLKKTRGQISMLSSYGFGDSLARRTMGLFWIAGTNFIFPVLLNIVQLAILFTKPDYILCTYVMLVNCYTSVVGVVFATVWSSCMSHKELDRALGTVEDAHTTSIPRITSVPGQVATVPLTDLPPRERDASLDSRKTSWNVSLTVPWPASADDGGAEKHTAPLL